MNQIDIVLVFDSLDSFKKGIDYKMKYEDIDLSQPAEKRIELKEREKPLSFEEAIESYSQGNALMSELKLSLDDMKILYEKIETEINKGSIGIFPREEAVELNAKISFITSFYERILKISHLKGFHVICVVCMDVVHIDKLLVQGKRETQGEFNGFYEVSIPVNYQKFKELSNYEKKKEALEFLMIGIRKIAEHQNWDMKPFEEAYNKIIAANYINEWKRDKPKELAKHKTKKIQAGLGTIQDIHKSEIFLFICDNKRNEIYRQTIATSDDKEYQKYDYSFSISEWKINWKDGYKVSIPNLAPEFELDYIQQAKEALKNEENLNEHIKKGYEELVNDKEKYENLLKEPKEWVFKIPLNIIEKAPLK